MPDATEELLRFTLAVAVPMWILELKAMTPAERSKRAAVCAQHVAEHGDLILYKSSKPGGTAEAFNRLAEGVACLAFAPGGVRCFGLKFDAQVGEPDRYGTRTGLHRVLWRRIRKQVEP